MQEPPLDVQRIVSILKSADVRFIIIGGIAVIMHGSDRPTMDMDLVYARDAANIAALVEALRDLHPLLRTIGGPVPFLWDARTVKSGFHFTLETDAGRLDLLGDAPGVGSFEELWERSEEADLYGLTVRVASIDSLIAMKRAVGRSKDLLHVMELERLKILKAEMEPADGHPDQPED